MTDNETTRLGNKWLCPTSYPQLLLASTFSYWQKPQPQAKAGHS